MCAVSAVGQYFTDNFPQRYPNIPYPPVTVPMYPNPGLAGGAVGGTYYVPVTQQQFEALREEVKELKELLLAAKKFDEMTGQPDCSMEEKVDLIKNIARLVGVDMKDVFPDNPQ